MKRFFWWLCLFAALAYCRHTKPRATAASQEAASPAEKTETNSEATTSTTALAVPISSIPTSTEPTVPLSNFLAFCRSPDTQEAQDTVLVLLAYVQEKDCTQADLALAKLKR